MRGKKGAGRYTIVSDKDYPRLSKYWWYFDGKYAFTMGGGFGRVRPYKLHQLLIKAKNGLQVDHINRDKLDNRRENLRLTTASINMRNKDWADIKKRRSTGRTDQYRGIRWKKKDSQWEARISNEGKQHYLGQFNSAHHAALVYDLWADFLQGKDAVTNFPIVTSG